MVHYVRFCVFHQTLFRTFYKSERTSSFISWVYNIHDSFRISDVGLLQLYLQLILYNDCSRCVRGSEANVSVTLNSVLAPIFPCLNSLLHDHAVACHFFIYNCSQVQVVCALRGLMRGSSNV